MMTKPAALRHNSFMSRDDGSYARIYAVVRRIPRGRVATYGQVARLADLPGQARQVGYALHALPDDQDVPWQRVINAQGRVSPRGEPEWEDVQRQMLEREGVRFDDSGRTALSRYQWKPRDSGPRNGELF
jgi:methylated-DNA-protein-cysteine methyltransferase-like protein